MADGEATIGFLVLDSRFPRIVGDAGCAATWHFPAIYETVANASPAKVVQNRARGLMPAFVQAGEKLIARGATGIATTCGFLCLQQQELSAALSVPFLSGALMMGRKIQSELPPDKKLGILTASAKDLSAAHLAAANIDESRAIIGGPAAESEFANAFLRNRPQLRIDKARAEIAAAAKNLCAQNNIGALLLECANMPPYAAAAAKAAKVPTFSVINAVYEFHRTLTP